MIYPAFRTRTIFDAEKGKKLTKKRNVYAIPEHFELSFYPFMRKKRLVRNVGFISITH